MFNIYCIYIILTILSILSIIIIKVYYYFKKVEEFNSFTGKYGIICQIPVRREVYGCGLNQFGQIGFNSGDNENNGDVMVGRKLQFTPFHPIWLPFHVVPVSIPYISNFTITKIAVGTEHSLFLTHEGRVYSCGYNGRGQLGLDSTRNNQKTPQLIQTYYGYNDEIINYNAITITKIASGTYQSLFLTDDGRVYSSGYNGSGQLGIGTSGNDSYKIAPHLIETYYGYNDEIINYNAITITKIATGSSHSLFLTDEGRVYSCGMNFLGQLGIGTSGNGSNKNAPQLIQTYHGFKYESINYDAITITQIACGKHNSFFIDNEGRVYGCGYNYTGGLGIQSFTNKNRPTLIHYYYGYNNEKINYDAITITQVASSDFHSLFLTNEGRVYSCGGNQSGQLGLNTITPWNAPKLIETYAYNGGSFNYDAIRITQIACGYKYSLFLTHEGRVYSCGINYYGNLGLNSRDKQTKPKLIQKYYDNNGGSINYNTITITEIETNYYHSFFNTERRIGNTFMPLIV